MTMFSDFWEDVKQGILGKNKGIPLGYPRFDALLNGVHRGRYYTIFSEGGTGKSSFVWSTFVINMLDYMITQNNIEPDTSKHINVKVHLYSLEVVKKEVIAKMVCYKIYKDHGIIIDPDYILSRDGAYKITPAMVSLVKSYTNYFNNLAASGNLVIIDSPRTPTKIRQEIDALAVANGTLYTDEQGEKRYRSNNPNEFVIIITDTVGNLTVEPVNNTSSVKTTIDLHSANSRYVYRDLYNFIPVNVSHSNRAMSDSMRAKMGEVFPKLSDIKETNMLEQDSSVVLTLFNPMNHITSSKELESFMGYDIKVLKERFRCLAILKNRHGLVNKRVGMLYVGENAYFSELPTSDKMTADNYNKVVNDYKHTKYFKQADQVALIKDEELRKKISDSLKS